LSQRRIHWPDYGTAHERAAGQRAVFDEEAPAETSRAVQPAAADALLDALIDVGPIVTLMRRCKVTFYDAAYHALAIAQGGVMVTADRRYARKCAAAGHVADLADWQPPLSRAPVADGEPG
jgi:RecB family endonuclease NucS